MSGWKKLAAAAAAGEGLSVEEVFSTYVYDGNGTTQTINNGIDLSGEGGMVWTKNRDLSVNHNVTYTDNSSDRLFTNLTNAADTGGSSWSYTSDGYSVTGNNTQYNYSGSSFASWTFRKAPKFFDVVTYTGNGTAGRTVSHNLGSVPGCIIVKRTDTSGDWAVFHRSLNGGSNPAVKHLELNGTGGEGANLGYWNDTDPTSTVFSVGINSRTNANGGSYVAYIFAHNDGDGDFGPTADQDIIKCGSYTGNSSGIDIDLGFEPQWFMCKQTNGNADWQIFDVQRGFHHGTTYQSRRLSPNNTSIETSQIIAGPMATGINIPDASGTVNITGGTYIYMAIRRGPMKTPENATDVFDVQRGASPFTSDFPVDLGIQKNVTSTGNWFWYNRLRGDRRFTMSNSTDQDATSASQQFDKMDQWGGGNWGSQSNGYSFRRAPGFFDSTIIKGNGSTTNTTHYHNLGVVPELIIGKQVSTGNSWWVYHKDVYPNDHVLNSDGYSGVAYTWNDSPSYVPTETTFTTRGNGFNEAASNRYLIYLWATLAGISKVGTYTGNGSSSGDSQNIDCGFSSGARFVMIKRINHIYSDWYVADTGRGINTGNDSYMYMNRSNAEYTSLDWIDPYSSGFAAVYTNDYGINVSGDTYMYLAIA
jgi:hypothetical protein